MKKTFLVLICFCFIFTGCKGYNKGPDVTVVTSGLSFVAKLSYMKNIYDYSVIIDKNGKTTINYISKSDEPGTDYIFEDDTVIYSYNGLEYKTDISAIPDNSIADFIYTVFKECKNIQNKVYFKNQEYYIKGETDKYKFKMVVGQTGLPIKITDSKMGISAIIKNPSIL